MATDESNEDKELGEMLPSSISFTEDQLTDVTTVSELQRWLISAINANVDLYEKRTLREVPRESIILLTFNNLCYCDQSCRKLPLVLAQLYGPKVHSLDLSYNELISLSGLEHFPKIRELILDNNRLEDSLVIPKLEHLHTLSLNKNNICDLQSLLSQIKQNLPSLTYLSLLGNKACPNQLSGIENDEEDYQRYRYFVLYHLSNLKFLDSKAVSTQERLEAKIRGQFMNVITPKSAEMTERDGPLTRRLLEGERVKFSPLSRALRGPDDFKGIYGKCRYRYSGKHSEGNRFISNQDL